MHKENKNNDFIQQFFSKNHVFRHYQEYRDAFALLSSARKQGSAQACSSVMLQGQKALEFHQKIS